MFESSNILVSVVMPVHNGELYLKDAIESILNQSYKEFELILVDNGSTDSSLEIISSYDDPKIKIVNEMDCGIVNAYNRGFKEAQGQYIIIHDHDDISHPKRIESLYKYLVTNDLDICGSSFSIIDSRGKVIKDIYPPIAKREIFQSLFYDFFSLFNPTLIIKKNVLEELNYFELNLNVGSDYDFVLRAINNYKCGNNPEVLLSYRYYSTSTSKKNIFYRHICLRKISLFYFKQFKDNLIDPHYTEALMYYFFNQNLNSLRHIIKSIWLKGFNRKKFRYLILTSIFGPLIKFMRKRNLFFNKKVILFLNKIDILN
jgi:glycosyltransferase involved in cell wall biosynthesis